MAAGLFPEGHEIPPWICEGGQENPFSDRGLLRNPLFSRFFARRKRPVDVAGFYPEGRLIVGGFPLVEPAIDAPRFNRILVLVDGRRIRHCAFVGRQFALPVEHSLIKRFSLLKIRGWDLKEHHFVFHCASPCVIVRQCVFARRRSLSATMADISSVGRISNGPRSEERR